MRGEPGVLDYLNKGLRHELTAINQYWLHYRLLDNWGYKALAKQWRKESTEEMQHADKLVERIIFLDGFPNMQVLDPLHIGQNVQGSARLRSCRRSLGARAVRRGRHPLPCGAGLRVARPVRETDARRGGTHRFPRNPARSGRQAWAGALRQHHIGELDEGEADRRTARSSGAARNRLPIFNASSGSLDAARAKGARHRHIRPSVRTGPIIKDRG